MEILDVHTYKFASANTVYHKICYTYGYVLDDMYYFLKLLA